MTTADSKLQPLSAPPARVELGLDPQTRVNSPATATVQFLTPRERAQQEDGEDEPALLILQLINEDHRPTSFVGWATGSVGDSSQTIPIRITDEDTSGHRMFDATIRVLSRLGAPTVWQAATRVPKPLYVQASDRSSASAPTYITLNQSNNGWGQVVNQDNAGIAAAMKTVASQNRGRAEYETHPCDFSLGAWTPKSRVQGIVIVGNSPLADAKTMAEGLRLGGANARILVLPGRYDGSFCVTEPATITGLVSGKRYVEFKNKDGQPIIVSSKDVVIQKVIVRGQADSREPLIKMENKGVVRLDGCWFASGDDSPTEQNGVYLLLPKWQRALRRLNLSDGEYQELIWQAWYQIDQEMSFAKSFDQIRRRLLALEQRKLPHLPLVISLVALVFAAMAGIRSLSSDGAQVKSVQIKDVPVERVQTVISKTTKTVESVRRVREYFAPRSGDIMAYDGKRHLFESADPKKGDSVEWNINNEFVIESINRGGQAGIRIKQIGNADALPQNIRLYVRDNGIQENVVGAPTAEDGWINLPLEDFK